MSQYERNTTYLEKHRIIYRRNPCLQLIELSMIGAGSMRMELTSVIHSLIHELK